MSEPAGLYVHIPYCSAVCPYCDFSVQVGRPEERESFIDTLESEIDLIDDWHLPIDSIYFGGGTPSLIGESGLERVLAAIGASLTLTGDCRLHFEVNPEDVSAEAVASWRRLGVHFLSIGVQSFDADELRRLGRRHAAEEGVEAVRRCTDARFPTVSIDLMFGLPGQRLERWLGNLEIAMALAPQHVSCYQLTVHPGTTFGRWKARGRLQEMPDDEQAQLFEHTHERLGGAGYAAYEVSNFAAGPEHRSRHNRKYWRHVPYLGIGPSAHSFDGKARWWNHREVPAYSAEVHGGRRPVAGSEILSDRELVLESLMLGLRTSDGIDLRGFRETFAVDLLDSRRSLIDSLRSEGYIEPDPHRLALTVKGLAVADAIAARLSPDEL